MDDSFLRRAKANAPLEKKPVASAFCTWLFGIEHPRYLSNRNSNETIALQKKHRFLEKEIETRKLWRPVRDTRGNFELLFADPLDGSCNPFVASRLKVDGSSLQCIPDVVLKDSTTNEIIIIERKITTTSKEYIPESLWLNLRGSFGAIVG